MHRFAIPLLCAALTTTSCALFPDQAPHCSPIDPAYNGEDHRAELDALPYGIRQVPCAKALCYVVPLDRSLARDASLRGHEVVLIDTGIDAEGELLLESLDGAKVVQVWVTHGHIDHWAAAHLFVDDSGLPVPVFVHRDDVPFMELRAQHRSLMATLGQRLLPLPPFPQNLQPFDDGERLKARGTAFEIEATAVHLPGHTPGSSAFLVEDVLFSGDTLVAAQPGGVCAVPGFLVTDDEVTAWRSLRKLRDVNFSLLLDGNYGRTDNAAGLVQPALFRWRKDRERTENVRP